MSNNTMDFGGVIKDVHDQDNHLLNVLIVAEYTSIVDSHPNTMDFGGAIKDAHDEANQALRLTADGGYIIVGIV